MAFDQPLEADRVDDLNLFSFLVRAPVVGTLMWMLGGDEAKKREEEEQLKKDLFAGVGSDSSSSQPAVELYRKPLHQSSQLKRFENMKMGKKSAPLLLGSDISDFGECAIEEEAREAKRLDKQRAFDFKKSRKMSWSDETGQDLVEYVEESMKRVPSSTSSLVSSVATRAKPIRSALKRSKSVQMDDNKAIKENIDPKRLVPKGLGGGPSGLVMPTRPFGDENAGYCSPEWGWYANMTPPTPEMYSSSGSTSKNSIASQRPASHPSPLSNPAFNKGGRSKVVHWPSVPF